MLARGFGGIVGHFFGGVVGAIGSIASGEAAAQADRTNAVIEKQTAVASTDQAAFKASEITRQTRLRVAAATAAGLENGFEDTGSMTTIKNQVQDTGELDKLMSIYDGSVRATGYNNAATMDLQKAGNDETAGFIGAGTRLLGGISSAYR